MSHISNAGSRFRSVSWDSTQRWPHDPMPTITGRRSSPASVSRYSTCPPAPGTVRTTPALSKSFSRLDNSAGDIRGTPRLRSLKRVEPQSSSRTTSVVQRVHRISDAIATGQNCP